MTPEPAPDQAPSAQTLRAALRHGLTTALKARDTEALAALRTAVAAIDNAEAIATTDTHRPVTSADIAGASSGVGSTEAVRQSLSGGELRDLVREQITEYAREPTATKRSASPTPRSGSAIGRASWRPISRQNKRSKSRSSRTVRGSHVARALALAQW
jgi:hypothetical protein